MINTIQRKSSNVDRIIHKSGIRENELLILQQFIQEPTNNFTLTEIKNQTGNKSHHYIFEALNKFEEKKVITKTKRGNTNIYALNPENQELIFLITEEYFMKEKRKEIPYKNIKQVTDKINNSFYTLIIGGSYAEETQKEASDLDVAFIIPNSDDKTPYKTALKEGELMVPEIHGHVFTEDEFHLMLTNQEFNLGKELAKKHVIYCGAEAYYRLLFKAIKNGFKSNYVFQKGQNRT
jgi:predicted nucleotidyltransferase